MRLRPHLYILDSDGRPVPVFEGDYTEDPNGHRDAVRAWGAWYEKADRIVRQTGIGPYMVSTIFLGIDHSFSIDLDDPPVLWETMVFASPLKLTRERAMDLDCSRYASLEEAKAGHQTTCDLVALEVERQEGARPTQIERVPSSAS